MFRRLSLALTFIAWASLAAAQIVLPGGGSGGGGAVTFATTCPVTTQTGSTITFTNVQTVVAQTGSIGPATTDCGTIQQFTLSGAATYSLPAPAAGWYLNGVTNVPTSTNVLTLSPASGLICSATCASTYSLAIGKTISLYSDGTNYYVSDSSNSALLQTTTGYLTNRGYPSNLGAASSTSAAQGAGNVACTPYIVAYPGLTFKTFGIDITTADTLPNFVSVAIYNSGVGVPSTLIDSTSVGITLASTGFVSAAPSKTTDFLAPGPYWVCTAMNSATGVVQGQTANAIMAGVMGGAFAVGTITGGVAGVQCTAASSGCGPTWASGSGSAYTWVADMHTATWAVQATSGRAPFVILQAN